MKRHLLTVTLAGMCLAAILGHALLTRTAVAQGASGAPAKVATVSLEQLVNGLAETRARNNDLGVRAAGWQKELDTLKERMDVLKVQLETIIPKGDNEERRKALREAMEVRATAEARKTFFEQALEAEKGEIIRTLYSKATEAIKKVAEQDGLDMVFVDDRKIEVPELAGQANVNATLQLKKVLYARAELDITERVLTRMNNEFEAGGGKAPPITAPKK